MIVRALALIAATFAMTAEAAEPLFLPDFAPAANDDYIMAVMLQDQVRDRLIADGHMVLTSEVAGRAVNPADIKQCGLRPECPTNVLGQLPVRVGVVVSLAPLGTTLVGKLAFFQASSGVPLEQHEIPIVAGNEHLFVHEVATKTSQVLGRMGQAPDAMMMAAAALIAGQPMRPAPAPAPVVMPAPMPPPMPVAGPPPVPQPAAPVPAPGPPPPIVDLDSPSTPAKPTPVAKRAPDGTPHTGDLDDLLKGTGVKRRHLLGSEQTFRNSGLDVRDWVYQAMPHAGRLIVEVRGGLGMGDNERVADMRVETSPTVQSNAWYQEAPAPSRRARGSAFLGYAPATFLDAGVLVGLQYGERIISTGIIQVSENGTESVIADPEIVQAVQIYFQPRIRTYVVPTGPAKPFLFTGAEIRVFDGYQIAQPVDLQYIVPPGGVLPGWVGGGGMMIDPGPILGLFAEGAYTRHFGPRSRLSEVTTGAPWPHTRPDMPASAGYTVSISGGIQIRL